MIAAFAPAAGGDRQPPQGASASIGGITNPLEVVVEAAGISDDNDDDDDNQSVLSSRSAASTALRNDFVRLMTTTSTTAAASTDHPLEDDEAFTSNTAALARNGRVVHGSLWMSDQRDEGAVCLGRASTTPCVATFLVPILCLVAHGLFAYGQTVPMWRLSAAAENVDVWANATTTTSQWAFDALDLPHNAHYVLHENHTVQEFDYAFAITELWEAKGMGSVVLPRIASAGLVLFSGIWPHLKLLLLQVCWWNPRLTAKNGFRRRTRTLGWLSLLGKWSLADVLTVCVMVGVLNIEWAIDPTMIKEGIVNHLQSLLEIAQRIWTAAEVCTAALEFDTSDCGSSALSFRDKIKCKACKTFMDEAYNRPDVVEKTGKAVVNDVVTGGGGIVRLSVVGLRGIYYFCAAVILSVLLSVIVDWFHGRHVRAILKGRRRRLRRQRRQGDAAATLTLASDEDVTTTTTAPSSSFVQAATNGNASVMLSENTMESDASEPLLDPATSRGEPSNGNGDNGPPSHFEPMEIDESIFSNMIQRTTNSRPYSWLLCHYIVPLVTLGLVCGGLFWPSMERRVKGGIPKLLRDILGVHLEKAYSFQTLQETTGAAGGWDLMLMGTFSLFCVYGPLLRAVLVVMVAATSPPRARGSTSAVTAHGNNNNNAIAVNNNNNNNNSKGHKQRIRHWLVRASDFLAAFCAWEVFLVAVIMVELIMPTATDTILDTKACTVVSGDGSSCVKVLFERVPSSFACLVVGLVMVSGLHIHVDMEDRKGRLFSEQQQQPAGGRGGDGDGEEVPTDSDDDEDDARRYYVEVFNGDDENCPGEEGTANSSITNNNSSNNNNNTSTSGEVSTVLQHEVV